MLGRLPLRRRRGNALRTSTLCARRRPRAAGAIGFAALLLGAGCASPRPALPPRPPLPAVRFVPPCDPQATVGLTAEGVEQLRTRDTAWRQYVETLERMIRGAQ